MDLRGAVERAIRRLDAMADLSLLEPPPLAAGPDLRGDHPGFPLRARARDDALAAIDRGETRYVDGAGIKPLREAIESVLQRIGIEADAEKGLMVTAGEQEARFLALQALAAAGVRLVFPSVVHPGARKAAALNAAGRQVLPLDLTTGAPDPGAVRAALAAGGPAALYLESPNRFTGKVIPPELLAALADEARRVGAFLVWDASLAAWVPDDVPYFTPARAEYRERTIALGTVWAGAGVEGWMIGYLTLPAEVYPHARRLKQVMALCTSVPVQWGTLGVLLEGDVGHAGHLQTLAEVKVAAVRVWPGKVLPGEAVSLLAIDWPDAASVPTPARGMAGTVFGVPGWIRFTVTATGEIVTALRALAGRGT